MARLFDGTNDSLQAAIDLSGVNKFTIVYWLYWDSPGNDDNDTVFELTSDQGTHTDGFLIIHSGANFLAGHTGNVGGSTATYTRPSANAWHHHAIMFDKSAASHEVAAAYVDGAAVTLTYGVNANNTNNFANDTLNFFSRNNASLFGQGRLAEVGIYPGVLLNADDVVALGKGVSPIMVRPEVLEYYWPLIGRTSPEVELINGKTATVNGGAATSDHPLIIYPDDGYAFAASLIASPSTSPSTSASASASTSASTSESASTSGSASESASPSTSASASPSVSPSTSASASPSTSSSASPSTSASTSGSASESGSATSSPTSSKSPSPSPSTSASRSSSASISQSASPSESSSKSPSASPSRSPSPSPSKSPSPSPSTSASASASRSPSTSASVSPSASASASVSASAGLDEVPCDLNLLNLRFRVSDQLDDVTNVYWTVNEVNHALNVAQRLWCLLTLCLERTVTFTLTTGQAFYEISDQIDDFIVPLRATFNGIRLRSDTIHRFDLASKDWRVVPGTPTRYAQHGMNMLVIYPPPSGATPTISLTYAAEPAPLVNDTDVPEIEPDQQIWLEKMAFWWCLLKNGGQELKNAGSQLNEYLDAATKYAGFTRSRSRAQLYDVYPIDLSTFDRGRFEISLANQPQMKNPYAA